MDPSPTDSNGTENTEIDEDSQEEIPGDTSESEKESEAEQEVPPTSKPTAGLVALDSVCNKTLSSNRDVGADRLIQLTKIATNLPARSRTNSDEAPRSVIHVPSGFVDLVSTIASRPLEEAPILTIGKNQERASVSVDTPRPHHVREGRGWGSPATPDAALGPDDKARRFGSVLY